VAETELRTELNELVAELHEITGEIRARLAFLNMNKYVRPVATVLIGYAGMKIVSVPVAIIWRYKCLIGASGIFCYILIRKNRESKESERDCI